MIHWRLLPGCHKRYQCRGLGTTRTQESLWSRKWLRVLHPFILFLYRFQAVWDGCFMHCKVMKGLAQMQNSVANHWDDIIPGKILTIASCGFRLSSEAIHVEFCYLVQCFQRCLLSDPTLIDYTKLSSFFSLRIFMKRLTVVGLVKITLIHTTCTSNRKFRKILNESSMSITFNQIFAVPFVLFSVLSFIYKRKSIWIWDSYGSVTLRR